MFVSVSGFLPRGADDLKDSIDSGTRVREYRSAFAIDNSEWKVGWVDAAGKQLSGIVVHGFIVDNYMQIASINLQLSKGAQGIPFAPGGPEQLLPGAKNERS